MNRCGIDDFVIGPCFDEPTEAEWAAIAARVRSAVRREVSRMSRTIRCKFLCNSVGRHMGMVSEKDANGNYVTVKIMLYDVTMTPVFSDVPDSENKMFWRWTPSGKFEMSSITEPMFEPDREYYIDITPAE